MNALVAAAKKEGTLNVIALPPTWANYGTIINTFEKKYGITVNSALPDGTSQQEVDAVKQENGSPKAPDVLDIGLAVALANTSCSHRTRSAPGLTSRPRRRIRAVCGTRTTAATWPSATSPSSAPSPR